MERSGNIPIINIPRTFNIRRTFGIFTGILLGTFSEYTWNISWECSTNIPQTCICLVGRSIISILIFVWVVKTTKKPLFLSDLIKQKFFVSLYLCVISSFKASSNFEHRTMLTKNWVNFRFHYQKIIKILVYYLRWWVKLISNWVNWICFLV